MSEPEQRSFVPGLLIVAGIAVALALAAYFSTRGMDSDVQGAANAQLGLSGAVLVGIAAISALVGAAILWTGRHKATSNTKVAIVATIFTGVFLLFVAYGVGSGSSQPASVPGPLNNS